MDFLTQELSKAGPKIVITHHPPSYLSLNAEYSGGQLDHAFASNLHALVEGAVDLKYWVHGHTHNSCNYKLPGTETTIFSNQRGYAGHEPQASSFDPDVCFEI